MATHDYIISNASGAAVRSDLNNALAAIVSNNSNATEPATTYSFMWWADITAGQLKLRNAANDGWVTIQELDGTMLMEDGTVGAPGLAFASDLDTGFYRGADNELGIATGGTSAIYIDDAQNVGIGSTNPGSYSYSDLVVTGATGGMSIVTGTSDTGSLVFADGVAGVGAFRGAVQYNHSADSLIFAANGGEKARIDSSGRLLVGTSSSPGAGDGQYSKQVIQGYVGVPTGQGLMSLQRGETASNITSNETIGVISFNDSDGYVFGQIYCQADANAGASDFPGRLSFATTPDGSSSLTERLRISNQGRLRSFGSDNIAFELATSSSAGTTNLLFSGNYGAGGLGGGTESIKIYSNGNVQNTNNSYTAISDIKLKENIVDAGSQWADLKALRVRNYNLKEGQTHKQIGLVAQEVEPISPGLVYESPDRDADGNDLGTVTKSVNYSVLYMKAVKALQEAMERIETLENKVAALEAQ